MATKKPKGRPARMAWKRDLNVVVDHREKTASPYILGSAATIWPHRHFGRGLVSGTNDEVSLDVGWWIDAIGQLRRSDKTGRIRVTRWRSGASWRGRRRIKAYERIDQQYDAQQFLAHEVRPNSRESRGQRSESRTRSSQVPASMTSASQTEFNSAALLREDNGRPHDRVSLRKRHETGTLSPRRHRFARHAPMTSLRDRRRDMPRPVRKKFCGPANHRVELRDGPAPLPHAQAALTAAKVDRRRRDV
jgi:hypothetical protein